MVETLDHIVGRLLYPLMRAVGWAIDPDENCWDA